MRITFVGGGNMASAMLGGLIRRGAYLPGLHVVEPQAQARERLAQQFAVATSAALGDTALDCDVLVLAVKPQQMEAALAPLAGILSNQVVVSIAAGTRLSSISRWLGGYRKVVRAMPNTPALIGEGITGLYADPSLSATERDQAQSVLAAAGDTLWVNDENQIDAITAISGSGPAYVFYFIEALEAAAAQLGFDAMDARKLALQTFKGASLLAAQSPDSPALLREKVTSKGGTTEAALRSMMDEDAVGEAIGRATKAAYERGQELGKGA